MTTTRRLALAAIAALGLAAPARAAHLQTYDLTYSGAPFGNAASATATITLDLDLVQNPGTTFQARPPSSRPSRSPSPAPARATAPSASATSRAPPPSRAASS